MILDNRNNKYKQCVEMIQFSKDKKFTRKQAKNLSKLEMSKHFHFSSKVFGSIMDAYFTFKISSGT